MEKLGAGDPQRIGAYRLLARLGAGGMGMVYLARSDRGRTVAVKLVRRELAVQEEFRARFRQEVAAARQVGGYWTAPVLDADTEAEIPWVATGYVAGPSLQTVVGRDHGALPERSVRILAAGLAHALEDIHAAGLIHRDLKPSNVLITIDGPRVIDFGIARALETVTDGGLTRTGAVVGSPGFMAPEQVRGDRITPACDVFCLGSILAYAATGNLPFGAANSGVHALMYRIAEEEPDLAGLPEGLYHLVRQCLRKDPTARPTLAQILLRTGAEDTVFAGRSRDPWLPSALVAQLGRHAVQLLDAEDPEEAPGEEPGTAEGTPGAVPLGKAAGAAGAPGAVGTDSEGAAVTPGEDGRAGAPDLTKQPPAAAPATPPGPASATPPGLSPTTPPGPATPPSAPAEHASAAPDGGAVPPPPGTPGSAPLDRLPTQIVGAAGSQPPPPSAPPGQGPAPAGYGFPQQHPQGPAGYGQQPGAVPSHGPGAAPGYGQQGAASGYGQQGPAPAPGYGYPQGAAAPQAPYGSYGQGGSPYGHGQTPYGHDHGGPGTAAPGLGPTPPYGPPPVYGPGQGVAPEPSRRSGRSSVLLVIVALVVALGAGGTVYAVMKKGGGKEDDAKGSGPTTSAPATPGPSTPEPSDPATSPEPTTESPDAGTIPEEFLGTWNAALGGAGSEDTRELVIQQGEVGDTVLSLTADGPLEGGGTYHCVFEAELTEEPADGGPLQIGPSTVTVGEPATSCSPGAATTVTLLPDGRLRRVDTAGKAVTYTKAG
ncbi:serine/threonine-protein kinase [Streptomyces ipomoeae]|uniref:serine/threonine-protein kinase n=1 Tax=Streptomyces ipomoeae TaxID=103232 RepID=UPI001146172D|nr:serine/threonine-protein kinase [Streptomyces ipomoeae]MDX2936872.1 protein kinase [Streptomyces ipomoeae]TQE23892.1 serine/threonine protein kinase [Streptomyces ipomoeae]